MEVLDVAQERAVDGLRRAQERRDSLTPEVLDRVEALLASVPSRLVRLFCGEESQAKSKGHQPCVVVSLGTFREFRKTHPVTHRWAEWEKSLDLGD